MYFVCIYFVDVVLLAEYELVSDCWVLLVDSRNIGGKPELIIYMHNCDNI